MKKTVGLTVPGAVLITASLVCYIAAAAVAVFATFPAAAICIGVGTLLFAAGMISMSLKKKESN